MSEPDKHQRLSLDRRKLFAAGGAGALGAAAAAMPGSARAASSRGAAAPGRDGLAQPRLRFNAGGGFRVLHVTDTQDDEFVDRRTVELIGKAIDSQKPDLVVFGGDQLVGSLDTVTEIKQAINNVVAPVEEREVPWIATFGNHDEDSSARHGWYEPEQLEFLMGYRHNLNVPGPRGVSGTGNMVLPVRRSDSDDWAFAVWLLDSGRYAPLPIEGQDGDGYMTYEWVHADQVAWYRETSLAIEKRLGHKVPGLLVQHIPPIEFDYMWWGGAYSRTAADHDRGVARHGIVGERNEDVYTGLFNSGLVLSVLERGDIKGIFCGHDHVNTYVGNYYGVLLGYSGNAGFGTYGLGGAENHRLRGVRVFDLDEDAANPIVGTSMVFARDLGIDTSPTPQPMDPLPLPDHA